MSTIELTDIERRMPTLQLIEDDEIREETARLTAEAPDYFWTVPATTSNDYHHPACRDAHGLWLHTLMLSTAINRLWDTYECMGWLESEQKDYAHAAAILHDQRKNGPPEDPDDHSVTNHDLLMAQEIYNSNLPDIIGRGVASHMGPDEFNYDGPEPNSAFGQLIHEADMIASDPNITCGVPKPVPDELADMGVPGVELE